MESRLLKMKVHIPEGCKLQEYFPFENISSKEKFNDLSSIENLRVRVLIER